MLEGTLEVIESSLLLLMQGFLEPIAQHVSRQLLNVFKDADSSNSLGNLLHCSVIPTTKKGFLIIESYNNLGRDLKNDLVPTSLQGYIQIQLLVFQFMCVISYIISGHHEKEPGSIFFRYLYRQIWSFHLWGKQFPALSALPHLRCSIPLIIFVTLHWTPSSMFTIYK